MLNEKVKEMEKELELVKFELVLKKLEVATLKEMLVEADSEIEKSDEAIGYLIEQNKELRNLVEKYESMGLKDCFDLMEKVAIVQGYMEELNAIGEKYTKLLGE